MTMNDVPAIAMPSATLSFIDESFMVTPSSPHSSLISAIPLHQ
jgi:hypothetical protein